MQKPTKILHELVKELKESAAEANSKQSGFLKEREMEAAKYQEGRKEAFSRAAQRLESVIKHIDTLDNKAVLAALIEEIDEGFEAVEQDTELPESAEYMIRHTRMLFTALQVILQEAL